MDPALIVQLILGLEPEEQQAILAIVHLFHKKKNPNPVTSNVVTMPSTSEPPQKP